MCSVYGRGLVYDFPLGVEGAPVDGDILEGDVLYPALGIVVGDVATLRFSQIRTAHQ